MRQKRVSNVVPFKIPAGKPKAADTTEDLDSWPVGLEFPEGRSEGCDEWCRPLHLVEQAIAGQPWAKNFDVDDFMIMSRLVDDHGTTTHYKHRDTRQYINVDDDGRTRPYREADSDDPNRRHGYSELIDLRKAVEALGLDWLISIR